MNVALARVLYAHALVAAPRLALGRLAPLGRLLGDPRLGMAGVFLLLRRVLPNRYPLDRDVAASTSPRAAPRADARLRGDRSAAATAVRVDRRGTRRNRACSSWFATGARSTPGRLRSDDGVLATCRSPPAYLNGSHALRCRLELRRLQYGALLRLVAGGRSARRRPSDATAATRCSDPARRRLEQRPSIEEKAQPFPGEILRGGVGGEPGADQKRDSPRTTVATLMPWLKVDDPEAVFETLLLGDPPRQ